MNYNQFKQRNFQLFCVNWYKQEYTYIDYNKIIVYPLNNTHYKYAMTSPTAIDQY